MLNGGSREWGVYHFNPPPLSPFFPPFKKYRNHRKVCFFFFTICFIFLSSYIFLCILKYSCVFLLIKKVVFLMSAFYIIILVPLKRNQKSSRLGDKKNNCLLTFRFLFDLFDENIFLLVFFITVFKNQKACFYLFRSSPPKLVCTMGRTKQKLNFLCSFRKIYPVHFLPLFDLKTPLF